MVWKISNFNMWTKKHWWQDSCTELTLLLKYVQIVDLRPQFLSLCIVNSSLRFLARVSKSFKSTFVSSSSFFQLSSNIANMSYIHLYNYFWLFFWLFLIIFCLIFFDFFWFFPIFSKIFFDIFIFFLHFLFFSTFFNFWKLFLLFNLFSLLFLREHRTYI